MREELDELNDDDPRELHAFQVRLETTRSELMTNLNELFNAKDYHNANLIAIRLKYVIKVNHLILFHLFSV